MLHNSFLVKHLMLRASCSSAVYGKNALYIKNNFVGNFKCVEMSLVRGTIFGMTVSPVI